MKKIIILSLFLIVIAIPVFIAVKNSMAATSAPDFACVQKAVEKRETAIISSYGTLSAALNAALEKRKTALIAAWGMTDAKSRRAARNTAWQTFRTEQKVARKTNVQSLKDAWTQFHTDAKACKVDSMGAEPQGLDISVSSAASASANIQ